MEYVLITVQILRNIFIVASRMNIIVVISLVSTYYMVGLFAISNQIK